ncbi:ANTAR domain-containing protein [Kibdelosporangium aridum]|uniref:ANTAR domain-containing protein n=1 Tax=Kibdelosporangium aridum TaxID=2030 RepID=A0A428ZKH2_KIBAR|nr:ANTAR domain-containing protein [Kibdelosporangium aridum]RSM88596.1 ANTAR domain-containing protein [Kibdelosporangium aridum]
MARPEQPIASRPDPRITTEWRSDEMAVVLHVRGEMDADGSRAVDHHLRTRIPVDARYVVVDLDMVETIGAPGVRTLIEHAGRLSRAGRRLLVVASNVDVRRALDVPYRYESLPLAMAACKRPREAEDHPVEPPPDEMTELRQEVFALRAAVRTRPVVAHAMGVIQERYHLPDAESAFNVLNDSAQRHDLGLYTLAKAVLGTPAPQGTTWFPGRTRRPAPSLSFVQQRRDQIRNRGAVLRSLLDAASYYMEATAAALQLVDEPEGVLRLELSANTPPVLTDCLVGAEEPASGAAARVVIADVAAEEGLACREVLLGAGIRAIQSTPLRTAENRLMGVVTTYHAQPGLAPTKLQCARLDHAATEVATWLEWHSRTVLPDALEHLHAQAR